MNIIGNWKVKIQTPFGEESCNLLIEESNDVLIAKASNEKGFIEFDSVKELNDSFIFTANVETPTQTKIQLELIESNSEINGILSFDFEAKLSLKGSR